MNANVGGENFDEAFKRVRDMDASLDEQLRAFADAARQRRPDFAAAVDRLVERLRQYGVGDAAPQAGEPMPPFVLPDDAGHMVSLDQLLEPRAGRRHLPPRALVSLLPHQHQCAGAGTQGDRGGRRSDRRHHARPAEIRSRVQVAVECAVPDPHRHGQRLCAVVESHDLGRRGNAEDDGRAPGPSDVSGQQLLDASDPGDVRRRARRDASRRASWIPDYRKPMAIADMLAALRS